MSKKWILTILLVFVAAVSTYLIYKEYNKISEPIQEVQLPENNTVSSEPQTPVVSPEKQDIIKAVIAKMTSIMLSNNAKKIREYTLSIYQTQEEKDAIAKLTDSQILKSAELYKELDLGKSISVALSYLPDSAWNISNATATITQKGQNSQGPVFTATKVNGVWQ